MKSWEMESLKLRALYELLKSKGKFIWSTERSNETVGVYIEVYEFEGTKFDVIWVDGAMSTIEAE